MKTVVRVALVAAALFCAGIIAVQFGNFQVRQLQAQVAELQRERERLVDFARRLSASRRVAQVRVLNQSAVAQGRLDTRVTFQEIASDGTLGRPLETDIQGDQLYIEALVLKFDHSLVGEGDAQRGASLAMFRRLFGNQQSPDAGAALDRALPPAAIGAAAEPDLHRRLWSEFWRLAEDPAYARRFGVRVAQVEAPSVRVRAGQVWEVSLDAAGGLNLRLITSAGSG